MAEVIERLEARITGRVQGVGFRYFTTQQARRLGIHGWVRNESDGSVRVVAEATRETLEEFLERLEAGPSGARVVDVDTDWSDSTGDVSGFTVRYF